MIHSRWPNRTEHRCTDTWTSAIPVDEADRRPAHRLGTVTDAACQIANDFDADLSSGTASLLRRLVDLAHLRLGLTLDPAWPHTSDKPEAVSKPSYPPHPG
jgi:hypothetical protein